MFNFSEGEIILIDKEQNWTSFDVINYIKPAIEDFEKNNQESNSRIKVGHAGTLDPLASGLLIICTGKKTKEISKIQQFPKTYVGTFFIGASTPSYDKELPVNKTYNISHITSDLIYKVAKQFVGKQLQIPPPYSAVNINGKRAYELARKNISVSLNPKPIEIYRFEITDIKMPLVHFEIECSKGTYIRSVANDFGTALNCGAYLNDLRRTKIGNYDVKDALRPREFINMLKKIQIQTTSKNDNK